MANKKPDNKRKGLRNRETRLGGRPHLTVDEIAGSAGPLPDGMTAVELAREARQIGFKSRWERYLAQVAEEREEQDS